MSLFLLIYWSSLYYYAYKRACNRQSALQVMFLAMQIVVRILGPLLE